MFRRLLRTHYSESFIALEKQQNKKKTASKQITAKYYKEFVET
jgi:hypothetical protein